MLKRILLSFYFLIILMGCASHPSVSPVPLKKGQSYTGLQFSVENVFPALVYRRGLSDISDFGLRIGIPIYGSGFDYSRVIYDRGDESKKYDVINLGISFNPNSNLDFTYYRVRCIGKGGSGVIYSGMRWMFIPRGISGGESVRFGPLFGFGKLRRWSLEIGYFHDFMAGHPILDFSGSQPLALFSPESQNDPKRPAVTDFGLPSEYSRLVGISIQFNVKMQFVK